jgi:hypothetical protein
MAASVCWEYVRMKPDYRYIIQPWSVRGYETPQGWVILACAVAVLLLAIPLSLRLLKGTPAQSAMVFTLATVFATLLPIVAKAPKVTPGWPVVWGLAVLLGFIFVAVAGRFLPAERLGPWRKPALFGIFAAVVVLAGLLVYGKTIGGSELAMWVPVLLLMLSLSLLMLARRPIELAPYRLLLIGITITWVIALICSGSLRSTLLRLQLEQNGIAAEYRDIQITSGILMTWLGGLLAFVGCVALWARRRDELEEHSRAGQQLAVAEVSASELEEAV